MQLSENESLYHTGQLYMTNTCFQSRVAQCIDKEILIGKNCDIDIGIDIDKEKFEKLIIYWYW